MWRSASRDRLWPDLRAREEDNRGRTGADSPPAGLRADRLAARRLPIRGVVPRPQPVHHPSRHGERIFPISSGDDGDATAARPAARRRRRGERRRHRCGERIDPDALMAALRPDVERMDVQAIRAVRHAARHSRGLPGRFVQALWPGPITNEMPRGIRRRPVARRGARLRVRVAGRRQRRPGCDKFRRCRLDVARPRGTGHPSPACRSGASPTGRRPPRAWHSTPSTGYRRPGAPGELVRRCRWRDVAGRRPSSPGRARDAQSVLDEAQGYAVRAGCDRLLIDIATLAGDAWVSLARLDEAERVLGAALAARESCGRLCANRQVRPSRWRAVSSGAVSMPTPRRCSARRLTACPRRSRRATRGWRRGSPWGRRTCGRRCRRSRMRSSGTRDAAIRAPWPLSRVQPRSFIWRSATWTPSIATLPNRRPPRGRRTIRCAA